MWLMEATGNYLYNRNAKYKHDIENLGLDFELCFKLQQGVSKQATVSKNEVLKEVEVLHRTIDSRSSSMSRLPRLVDYEIASIKEGMVNFKVKVALVESILRKSYDANNEYSLPEQKVSGCSNGIRKLNNSCAYAQNLGYFYQTPAFPFDYVNAMLDCLETNYGQYFLTNVGYASSHGSNYTNTANCYDDGTYNEYAFEGILHDPRPPIDYNQYGIAAINLWNNDICSSNGILFPFGNPVGTGTVLPTADYIQQTYDEISGKSYWCIQGIYFGLSSSYNDD